MRFCSFEGCNVPVFSTDKITRLGWCKKHQYMRTDLDRRTILQRGMDKQKGIESKVRTLGNEQDRVLAEIIAKGSAEMNRWFNDRRNEMTGSCAHCGGKSEKNSDKYFKFSIAHLLPKSVNSGLPSVKTHPDNWLELCHFGKSCHTNFDNHMIDIIDLNCFDQVIEKFVKIYPAIALEERRRIPPILLEYLKTEI